MDASALEPFRGMAAYRAKRVAEWDRYRRKPLSRYYHERVRRRYQHFIPPGARVLEIGCGRGDLLASVKPAFGVGLDFSPVAISHAKAHHPALHFAQAEAHNLCVLAEFDYIIVSELVNDLWDVQAALSEIAKLAGPHTRILINFYNHLWSVPLRLSHQLGVANPVLNENWLTYEDIGNMLYLANFEVIRHTTDIAAPVRVPWLSNFCNRYLVRLWPFYHFALTHFVIARPMPSKRREATVSVIVPARNEAGNIDDILARLPDLGWRTELIFVEGNSTDGTYDAIERKLAAFPGRPFSLYRESGKGKGDAVRLGFAKATGDILMILDADLTVPPEDIRRFYETIVSGKGEFVNGVRLVYPMEDRAMRFFNLAGNKFFSLTFSWLLGQSIKDTLCGTKVLWRKDYEKIASNRSYFGDFDPFGDFDLLFGAAKLNLRIVDLAVRYRHRKYGTTNIQRWRHGMALLRMA